MTDLTVNDTEQTPDTTQTASRRDTLRNGLVAAGLVTAIAGTRHPRTTTPAAATPRSTPAQPGRHTLTLTTDDLYTDADGHPQPGTTINAYATVHLPDGTTGRLYATLTIIDHTDDHDTLAHETHTFVLPDATIIGAGVSTIDDDQPDTYAIIGGTGRYLGARGQYTATQHHTDLGGDGTATYDMTIIVDHLTDEATADANPAANTDANTDKGN